MAHIQLPDRCADRQVGRPQKNCIGMASSHLLYALYLQAHGTT